MRIWVDPAKLISPGRLGDSPAVPGQRVTVPLTVQGQLGSVEEFAAVVLSRQHGRIARADARRRARGAGRPGLQLPHQRGRQDRDRAQLQLTPGGNAVKTAQRVLGRLEELKPSLPKGLSYSVPSTPPPS
ncbi:multidrug export protein AcrF [Ditylenchus destructor]|nr:multidrug export protein AcrF [Ditylenchus destructor]